MTSSVKLLLVGHDAATSQVLQAALASPEHELVAVSSSAEAAQELEHGDCAVVLLASTCTLADRTGRVPVIIVDTGEPEVSRVIEAYRSGAAEVIEWPFQAEVARAKVAVFVALFRANQEVLRQATALREAERARLLQQQFLATLSQELRPPLNAILGWIRMLRDGTLHEPQRARALAKVEYTAVAQLALIEEMNDISRITSNSLTLELGTVDLKPLVDQVVEGVRPEAVEKQVTLFAAVDDGVRPISGDAGRLRQIVHQLVSDAVGCTPTEGVVTVSMGYAGTGIEIAITSTGPGAPVGGLDVGLAITRHLVELHDGTMAASNNEGASGHRVVVTLPVEGRMPRSDDEVR